LFSLSTPVLFRHLWQLQTVVFQHWCLVRAVLTFNSSIGTDWGTTLWGGYCLLWSN